MAYIPPHKRLVTSAAPPTNIASPASASRFPSPSPHNHVKVDYSPFAVSRFLVISESSTRLLEFIPFESERVFSHLKGSLLHVIKRHQDSAVHEEANSPEDRLVDCKFNAITEISANSDLIIIGQEDKESAICHSIVEALRDDLTSVIQELKKRTLSDDAMNLEHPKILLSVGSIIFSSIDGQFFDWKGHCTPEYFEQQFKRRGRRRTILKTFFDDQPSNLFTFFKETAEKDNLQIRTKKRYSIAVKDNANPGTLLYCVCYLAGDSTATFQENGIILQHLEIRKAKRPIRLRHMVADLACIDKSHDVRIQLYTDEKCITAEERSDLESLLGHVLFVDGQPFLSHGDLCSTSGRFEIDDMFLSETYSFKGATFKWRLECVHGMRYVRIKPILVQDYLQGHVECTMDELMRSIEETLVRLWKCCF